MSRRDLEARKELLALRRDMTERILPMPKPRCALMWRRHSLYRHLKASLAALAKVLPAEGTVFEIARRDGALLDILRPLCPPGASIGLADDIVARRDARRQRRGGHACRRYPRHPPRKPAGVVRLPFRPDRRMTVPVLSYPLKSFIVSVDGLGIHVPLAINLMASPPAAACIPGNVPAGAAHSSVYRKA